MRNIRKIIIYILISLMFFAGCVVEPPVEEDLPVKTIMWEEDNNGYLQFYTNDKQYYNNAFWISSNAVLDPMTVVEAEAIKKSGNKYYGYGINFCFQDNENFYFILIDNNGYYFIGELYNNSLNILKNWTFTSALQTGYNKSNIIKVVKGTGSLFNIYFNDSSVTSFDDSSFTTGRCGFFANVGISSHEDFPNEPVDIRFKMIDMGDISSPSPVIFDSNNMGKVIKTN